MNILMTSINPLFADRVIGGSTKHLQKVAIRLGELGHDVVLLCTRHPDSQAEFKWHERVTIKPVWKFKQPFPLPYAIPAYQMAQNIQITAEYIDWADRFYMHDGEFLFPPVYADIPAVISLRDNAYPETMVGSFLFQADSLITIAPYSTEVVLHGPGRFIPELKDRVVTIPNGINWEKFRPKPVDPEIFEYIPVNPAEHTIVLHPHRPETSKGLKQTVETVDLLVHKYGVKNLLTLVPNWFDTASSPDVLEYLNEIQQMIEARNLTGHFLFHQWVPQRLMPDYYNLGDVMLALGHFVEAFGNTVYESLGCGTPSIAARVGPHRNLVPDHLLDKVHFDDQETAAKLAHNIISQQRTTSTETMAYLHTHYGVDQQLDAYVQTILNAKKLTPVTHEFRPLTEATHYKLAPWCYVWDDFVFHDFDAKHTKLPWLTTLLEEFDGTLTVQAAHKAGILAAEVHSLYQEGYLVPL